MSIDNQERDAIIAYRIDKSRMALKEALDNAGLQNWSLTANRLYYATFYMALAINLSNNEISKTHNGTFNLFSKKYIQTGLLTKEESSLYRRLFSMRQSGDYDDLFDWEENDILPLIPQVMALLDKMRSFISLQ